MNTGHNWSRKDLPGGEPDTSEVHREPKQEIPAWMIWLPYIEWWWPWTEKRKRPFVDTDDLNRY